MTTMKQRAAARRNIKKAIAANRRGGKKHKKSHRSGRSSAGASSSEAVGSAYINGKMGVQVLSPVSDYGLSVLQKEDALANAAPALKYKIVNAQYGAGAASSIAQRWADKKIGQAAALSRGSVTAWISELIPVGETIAEARGSTNLRLWNASFVRHTTGYNPSTSTFGIPEVAPYLGAKYGLGIARKGLTKFPIVGRPVKKALRMLGATV